MFTYLAVLFFYLNGPAAFVGKIESAPLHEENGTQAVLAPKDLFVFRTLIYEVGVLSDPLKAINETGNATETEEESFKWNPNLAFSVRNKTIKFFDAMRLPFPFLKYLKDEDSWNTEEKRSAVEEDGNSEEEEVTFGPLP